eukprot:m51a1_g11165 hypothetical protein (641) ;mRNA; r:291463-294516
MAQQAAAKAVADLETRLISLRCDLDRWRAALDAASPQPVSPREAAKRQITAIEALKELRSGNGSKVQYELEALIFETIALKRRAEQGTRSPSLHFFACQLKEIARREAELRAKEHGVAARERALVMEERWLREREAAVSAREADAARREQRLTTREAPPSLALQRPQQDAGGASEELLRVSDLVDEGPCRALPLPLPRMPHASEGLHHCNRSAPLAQAAARAQGGDGGGPARLEASKRGSSSGLLVGLASSPMFGRPQSREAAARGSGGSSGGTGGGSGGGGGAGAAQGKGGAAAESSSSEAETEDVDWDQEMGLEVSPVPLRISGAPLGAKEEIGAEDWDARPTQAPPEGATAGGAAGQRQPEPAAAAAGKSGRDDGFAADVDFGKAFANAMSYTQSKVAEIGSVKASALENNSQLNIASNPRYTRALFEILNAKRRQISTAYSRQQITAGEYRELQEVLLAAKRDIGSVTSSNTLRSVQRSIRHQRQKPAACEVIALGRGSGWSMEGITDAYCSDEQLRLCVVRAVGAHLREIATQVFAFLALLPPCTRQWIMASFYGSTAIRRDNITSLAMMAGSVHEILRLLQQQMDRCPRILLSLKRASAEWRSLVELIEAQVQETENSRDGASLPPTRLFPSVW